MASVLIIGSGAREFIFAKTFSQTVDDIFIAPGNDGMRAAGFETVNLTDIADLIDFAKEKHIDLTLVGAENLLMQGVVDKFEAEGLNIFGPTQAAAQLEGSKSFSKDILERYQIPTASATTVDSLTPAINVLKAHPYPVVVKLDGLALGKGVSIYENQAEALEAVRAIYEQEPTATLVIEEFMEGTEFSIFSFVGKNQVLHTPTAQDHKRLLDQDKGPNTGGMGAYSPVRWLDDAIVQQAIDTLVQPVLDAMQAEGHPFQGILYTGVMLTPAGPKVIEYNVRFGDPEAQVVLPQLKSDLLKTLQDLLAGVPTEMSWQTEDVYLGVTLAAPGYPIQPEHGTVVPTDLGTDIALDYAGVKNISGQLVSHGGRVATAVLHRPTMALAQKDLYQALDAEKTHLVYRHDIGYQAVEAEQLEGE